MCNFHLLAEFSQWQRLGERFQGRALHDTTQIWMWLAVLAGFSTIIIAWYRWSQNRDPNRLRRSPVGLFHELCEAHQLDRNEKRALKKLASGLNLSQPALLFLEPNLLEHPILGDFPDARKQSLRSLREKLFAGGDTVDSRAWHGNPGK